MTQAEHPVALLIADECEENAKAWHIEVETRMKAAAELRRLNAENTTLQQGYDAARLEIESLKARLEPHPPTRHCMCADCAPSFEPSDDGWMQDGGLLYRLTDGPRPKNRDEINVTMADGSRSDEARARRAGELLERIRAMRAQAAPENILGIMTQCREFIDTTLVPAYPAGADLADKIDALLAAQAAPAAADSYVQPVPDKCDRITWRGSYYHLPLKASQQPAPTTKVAPQPAVQQGELIGWIKSSEIDSAKRMGGSINLWLNKYDCDKPLYTHPAAPVAQGDALPREDFAWMVVQEACETEPADEDDPECIRILRHDLKSAVLAAFLREDDARSQAKEGGAA